MGTMGVAWSERVDLGPVCQRAGRSSEGRVFPYCASAAPWCCERCYFTHIFFFFLAGTLNVPKVFWQSPQVLQFPRLSQKQNNHGQVQIHTSVRLSQKHVVTQGGERPCGWLPWFGDLCRSAPMPASHMSIRSLPCVVRSRAIPRTLWDSAGKCIFLCEKDTWRLAIPLTPPPTPRSYSSSPGPSHSNHSAH